MLAADYDLTAVVRNLAKSRFSWRRMMRILSRGGGGEATGVCIFLQSHCSVGADLWCGDLGGYPPHGKGTEGFIEPGGAAIDRVDPEQED